MRLAQFALMLMVTALVAGYFYTAPISPNVVGDMIAACGAPEVVAPARGTNWRVLDP